MRNLFLGISLFFLSATSYAADLYTSIKSSLYESISEGINVQLIDANISHNYLLIQVTADTRLVDTFTNFKLELMANGYQVNYGNSAVNYTFVIKQPRETIETTLQKFINSLEGHEIHGLELVILGSINQQRLLGSFNRSVKSSGLKFDEKSYDAMAESGYDISLKTLDFEEKSLLEYDWKLALATGLLNCNYLSDGYVSFSYYQQNLACGDFFRKSSLTDKDVANLKDKLYTDIQLSIQTPTGFLQYIASFRTERRLELSQSFFTQIPNLSIDSILTYQYKRLLNIDGESEAVTSSNTDETISYRLPGNYKIKSQFQLSRSNIIDFNIAINNSHTCLQLNCQSLANLPYIDYRKVSDMHIFSMRFPASHETSVLDELNKVLFIPLSTANDIAQEDLLVSLNGGYLLEAYDESFRLLSNLALVNPSLTKGEQINFTRDRISFYLNQDNQSTIQLEIGTIPGGELWEESELFYFILLNEALKTKQKIVANKSNTLIHLSMPELVYLELDGSTIVMDYSSSDNLKVENFIQSFSEQLAKIKFELSRDQFVRHKQGLIVNLGLQETSQRSIRQLSQMFDLESPDLLLIKRLEALSFEQFKSFLENSITYSRIFISTSHELDSTFQQSLIKQINLPN